MSNYDFFIKIQKQSDGERQTIQHNDAGTSEYLQPKGKKVTKKGRRKRGREEGRKGGKSSTQVSNIIQELTQCGSWT